MVGIRKPFVIFIALVSICMILGLVVFRDAIAKRAILNMVSSLSGRPVEVDSVTVTLAPLEITVIGMAFPSKTHGRASLQDDMFIGRIDFGLQWTPLLKKKVIIDRISVLDVMISRPRKVPFQWPLPKKKETQSPAKSDGVVMGYFKTMLGKFDLDDIVSVPKSKAEAQFLLISSDIEASKTYWASVIEGPTSIPAQYEALSKKYTDLKYRIDHKKINTPEEILEAIAHANTLIKDATALKFKVDADLKKIKQDKTQFLQAIDTFKGAVTSDMATLKKVSHLPKSGSSEFTNYFLKDDLKPYLSKAQQVAGYVKEKSAKASPGLLRVVRDRGEDIVFVEPTILPLLWIKAITFSASPKSTQRVEGALFNGAYPAQLIADPLTMELVFKGQFSPLSKVGLSAIIDHRYATPYYRFKGDVTGFGAPSFTVMEDGSGKVSVASAMLSSVLVLESKEGSLSGSWKSKASDIRVDTLKKEMSDWSLASLVSDVVSPITEVGLTVELTGKWANPEINIYSDIDTQLYSNINRVFSDRRQKLIDTANAQLQAELTKLTQSLNTSLDQAFGDAQAQLADIDSQLADIISTTTTFHSNSSVKTQLNQFLNQNLRKIRF